MMAADSLHVAVHLVVPSGVSFRLLLLCRRACSAGAFASHFALPPAQPSTVQASCLEHGRPAAIAVFAGALAAGAALPPGRSCRERMRHTEFPMTARHGGCGRHEAALGRVPRPTHVQTGLVRTVVPHPSILPSAFASRLRSRQWRPGGAALLAASPPANAARAAGRARSRQDACTVDGCAVGSAKCNANAFALHARRHGSSHRMDTPDGTMQCTSACSESAAIMGVNPARPGAPRRSRRMR